MRDISRKKKYYFIPTIRERNDCPICGRDLILSRLGIVMYDAFNRNSTAAIMKVNFCNACCIPYVTEKQKAALEKEFPGYHIESNMYSNKAFRKITKEYLAKKTTMPAIPIKNVPKQEFIFSGEVHNHSCSKDNLTKYNFLLHGEEETVTTVGYECNSCKRILLTPADAKKVKAKCQNYIYMSDTTSWSEVFNYNKSINLLNVNQYTKDICPACNSGKLMDKDMFFKNDESSTMQRKAIKECSRCSLVFARSSNFKDKPYSKYKFSYDYYVEEKFRKQGKHIVLKAGDFLTRHNMRGCLSKGHSLEDITARIKIADITGKEFDYDVPAVRCDTCGKLFILEKEYQKIINKGIPLCSIVENEYWRDKAKRDAEWSEAEKKGSVMYIHGYNVNANIDLPEAQRHSILRALINDKVLTKGEICSHLDMLIQRAEATPILRNALVKWQRDRNYIENYDSSLEIWKVNSITRKTFKERESSLFK